MCSPLFFQSRTCHLLGPVHVGVYFAAVLWKLLGFLLAPHIEVSATAASANGTEWESGFGPAKSHVLQVYRLLLHALFVQSFRCLSRLSIDGVVTDCTVPLYHQFWLGIDMALSFFFLQPRIT